MFLEVEYGRVVPYKAARSQLEAHSVAAHFSNQSFDRTGVVVYDLKDNPNFVFGLKGEPAVWISKIKINNFKSLVDFEIDLAKFNCLIGLNGSGKSTILQAIDFLAQLIRGDLEGWLKKRRWRANELTSRLLDSNQIDFFVEFSQETAVEPLRWFGQYDVIKNYCIQERMELGDSSIEVIDGELQWSDDASALNPGYYTDLKIFWKYQGSVLSSLISGSIFSAFMKKSGLAYYFRHTRSFDMLSPELLRRRTKEVTDSIGLGGETFSSYLSNLKSEKQSLLANQLQEVYPRLAAVKTETLNSGRKQTTIEEVFGSKRFATEARHVNDGFLRLAALLAMLESNQEFLLFDEIENGINAELIEFLIKMLTQAKQQIIVTTHSPMILNFLEDNQARQGVIYLDKRADGTTRATSFFKIPSLDRKLSVMGAGEAFVDTDLLLLGDEIDRMAESG